MRVIGIRRENYGTLWERRTPLNPKQVKELIDDGFKVIVQPSCRRIYPDVEYKKVGAIVQDDLSEASLIIGIKQVPIPDLIPNKTYAFFAHVIKAQPDNMDMLDAILQRNIRLMDWETMCNEDGRRIISFGRFAGLAGMLNILHGMGLRYLGLGYNTPFIYIAAPHSYRSLASACAVVKHAGDLIANGAISEELGGPITFVFLGDGAVSKGAQHVLSYLPVEYVEPCNFKDVAQNGDRRKVYATILRSHHHMVRKSGEPGFSREEYDTHPDRYRSVFAEEFAPYTSCLINAVLWKYDHPRTLSLADTKTLFGSHHENSINGTRGVSGANDMNGTNDINDIKGTNDLDPTGYTDARVLKRHLVAICDITADPSGSIEFVSDCTTIEQPFELYNVETGQSSPMSFSGNGILVCSVANMPSQLPAEASDSFGEIVLQLITEMVSSDASTLLTDGQFTPTLQKSIIASNGKLTPDYEYIYKLRDADEQV